MCSSDLPVGEALVEKDGGQANQPGMNDTVEVDTGPAETVAGAGGRNRGRCGGRGDTAEAGGEKATRGAAFGASTDEVSAKSSIQLGMETIEEVLFFYEPLDVIGGETAKARDEHGKAQEAARDQRGQDLCVGFALKHSLDVFGANPALGTLGLVALFGEVWFVAEAFGGIHNGGLEDQMLEGVERVVVDENANGTLRG